MNVAVDSRDPVYNFLCVELSRLVTSDDIMTSLLNRVDGICGSGQSGIRSKMGVWKMQEWTYRHDMARVDNAGGKNVSKLA